MNQQHLQNNQNAAKNYMNNPGNPQQQQQLAPQQLMPDGCGGAAGADNLQNDLLLQLQQIHQYVAQSQPDILANQQKAPGGPGAANGAVGNPE